MSFNRKKERLFLTLILCIGLMAGIASAVGLLSVGGPGPWEYQAVGGEWVQIVGEGIYRNDSVSYVAQGKASDLVTLVLGIPLLILSASFGTTTAFSLSMWP
jgi:hypothetical protein